MQKGEHPFLCECTEAVERQTGPRVCEELASSEGRKKKGKKRGEEEEKAARRPLVGHVMDLLRKRVHVRDSVALISGGRS